MFRLSYLSLFVLLVCAAVLECNPVSHCHDHSTPLLNHDGTFFYCGLGGQRCPDGYHCNVAPNDAWAQCCRNAKVSIPKSHCPATKLPYVNTHGSLVYCGRGGQRCPSGYYCEISPVDAYAECCSIQDVTVG